MSSHTIIANSNNQESSLFSALMSNPPSRGKELVKWIKHNRAVNVGSEGVEVELVLLFNDFDVGFDGYTGKEIPKHLHNTTEEERQIIREYIEVEAVKNDMKKTSGVNESTLASAFEQVASTTAEETKQSPIELGLTENDDINYSSLSSYYSGEVEAFAGKLLELSQKLVNDEIKTATKYKHTKGHGSKRKASPALPEDPVENIPSPQRMFITTKVKELFSIMEKTSTPINQGIMFDMFIRSIFRERAVTGGKREAKTGKGHRSISYLLFSLLHKEHPDIASKMIGLFPTYGYFKDLSALTTHFVNENKKPGYPKIATDAIDVYMNALDQDIRKLTSGKGFPHYGPAPHFSHSDFKIFVDKLSKESKKITFDEFLSKYPEVKGLSLAAKWFPREGKHNSSHRNRMIHHVMTKGGLESAKVLANHKKYMSFTNGVFRKFISSLTYLLGVVEPLMATQKWSEIDPSKISSGATIKYRKALANELVDTVPTLYQQETGNRTTEPARIELRKKIVNAAVEGKLNGKIDSMKLADAISKGNISTVERKVLHAQFMDLVKDHKEKIMVDYKSALDKWMEEGSNPVLKPTDPQNVISTIDVSSSMGQVMSYAIVNGLITMMMSKLGRFFITFDNTPQLIKLEGDNIVDWYEQVRRAPWGGSTNMRGAMNLLIKVMKDVRKIDTSFDGKIIHIIHTDGQFNSNFAGFGTAKSSYNTYGFSTEDTGSSWKTFADEMKVSFTKEGFAFPLTAFWNYRSQTPGFPVHGKFKGVKLVEGLSTGLLMDVLGGSTKFTVDKTGAVVADTDPVITLLESLARFSLVGDTLYKSDEFVYKEKSAGYEIERFWSQYIKTTK
uniref:VWFA domain-containing protein n=1 Tax=viral metagenome TaxID=1070528 RepID=A0A6C0J479_9ZZZZ